MKILQFLESVLKALLVRIETYRNETPPISSTSVPLSENHEFSEISTEVHLERLQAQVHYLGYQIEVMQKSSEELQKKVDYQTTLTEELLTIFEAAMRSAAQKTQDPEPTTAKKQTSVNSVGIDVSPSKTPKKQILN